MKKTGLNFSERLLNQFLKMKKKVIIFKNYFFTILGSFIIATALNTYISTSLSSTNNYSRITPAKTTISSTEQQLNNSVDALQLKKLILERNIFNINGKIPPEDLEDRIDNKSSFEEIPCSTDSKIPVEFLGVIYTGNPNTSLAILKDTRVETADIYKEGQSIIDNNEFEIFKITGPATIQVRHRSTKICLSLEGESDVKEKENTSVVAQNADQSYELSSDFVNKQIGEGYAKILNSAHLAPETLDGKTIGFKISTITNGSLFDTLKIQNGDIITAINDISLEDATQGFKLYEVFQDEANIVIKILRQGKKITKKVTIR